MPRARDIIGDHTFLEIEDGENENQLMLDHNSGLESTLQTAGCLPILVASVLFYAVATGEGPPWVLGLAVLISSLGAFSFYLLSALDDRHILDFAREEMLFYRKFGPNVTRTPLARFSELHSLVLTPRRESQKSGVTWYYGLTLYTRQGKRLTLINPSHREYQAVFEAGQALAKALKLKFESGPRERLLKVTYNNQGPVFEFVPYSLLASMLKFGGAVALVVTLGYLYTQFTL